MKTCLALQLISVVSGCTALLDHRGRDHDKAPEGLIRPLSPRLIQGLGVPRVGAPPGPLVTGYDDFPGIKTFGGAQAGGTPKSPRN